MSPIQQCAAACVALLATGCGGSDSEGPVTAAACFDTATFAKGAEISQRLDHGTRLNWTVSPEVITYNGVANLLKISNNVVWEENMPGSQSYYSELYISAVSTPQIVSYGTYYTGGSGFTLVRHSEVYSRPYIDKRFALKRGESVDFEYSGTSTTWSQYGPDAGTRITDFTTSGSVKFDGLEPVTIGERSVQACRFTEGVKSVWYYRGMQVQRTNPNRPVESFRTLSLTRNGEAY